MATKGIEWVNNYHGRANNLSNNDNNAQGFYNKLNGTKSFEYGDDLAWDQDFEESGIGSPAAGSDSSYADNADIVFFSGHGSSTGLFFGRSTFDDGEAKPAELGLGNKDCEWLVADACQFLDFNNVFNRLRNAFKGLHFILGFHTTCLDVKDRGEKFAGKLNDGQRVRDAWINACAETEDSGTECAYLRADSAGTNTFEDHWHGKGFVSSDPSGSVTLFYLKTSC
jgi:hypothetical protein